MTTTVTVTTTADAAANLLRQGVGVAASASRGGLTQVSQSRQLARREKLLALSQTVEQRLIRFGCFLMKDARVHCCRGALQITRSGET